MGNAEGYSIDWFTEWPGCSRILQQIQDFNARLEGLADSFIAISFRNISLCIIFLIGGILNFLINFRISLAAASIYFEGRSERFILCGFLFDFFWRLQVVFEILLV